MRWSIWNKSGENQQKMQWSEVKWGEGRLSGVWCEDFINVGKQSEVKLLMKCVCISSWRYVIYYCKACLIIINAKLTTPTPLSLYFSCKLSFSIVALKIPSLCKWALKSTNFHVVLQEPIKYLPYFPLEAVLHIVTFIFSWEYTFRTIPLCQWCLSINIWHPVTNKLCSLNCWYIFTCKKMLLVYDTLSHYLKLYADSVSPCDLLCFP
jgi:hypothetical protein